MPSREITIECFGCLKSIDHFVKLSIPEFCSVLDAKTLLSEKLGHDYREIINNSVLADNNQIYTNHETLPEGEHFSILPPVCGG